MASRGRKKSSSSGRKKTSAAKRGGSGAKRSTAARKTTTRKTASRKTSGGARKKTSGGTKKPTSRKSAARKSAPRKSTARKTASKRTGTRAAATRRAPRRLELRSLDDVLRDQIADLHSAERQLVEALPKVARAASAPELRQAFEHHLEETRGHVRRLDTIIGQLGGVVPDPCEGMRGLIREGEEIVDARGDAAAKDAALIAAAQRIEHYEIAAYGTAKTLAGELGLSEARDLLGDTLSEESNADTLLTRIATGGFLSSGVNEEATE